MFAKPQLAIGVVLWLSAASVLAAAERIEWLTGSALRKKLQQPESVTWSGQPLRDALQGLSQAQRIAVLIDRRVDPGQAIDFSLLNQPLHDAFAAVAQRLGLAVSIGDALIYLGPPATARRLRTLVELRKQELRDRPAAVRLIWLQNRPWQWPDFTTPRDLLKELAAQGKVEIKGLERVPHDLWAAADLPPLGLVERLSLVLAQFDYTWQWQPEAEAIQIQPMPDEVWLERSYPGGSKPQELADRLAQELPGAQVRVASGKVLVRGLLEQHEQVGDGAARTSKPAVQSEDSLERRTFTLTATNQQVQAILKVLQEKQGLQLRYDAAKLREAGLSMETLVSVKVKDANLDETLKAVLGPAKLKFRRMGKIVEIEPE